MCLSRLHRVVAPAEPAAVWAEDLDGIRRRVSLLAFDGPTPVEGDWLVVHSGYALQPADAADAADAAETWRDPAGSRARARGATEDP